MINSKKFPIGLGLGLKDGISYPSLDHALKSGIRFFDTSTYYSLGALTQLSECLTDHHIDRSDVHLCVKLWVTTLGKNRQFDYDTVDRALDENVKAYIEDLKIGYSYIYISEILAIFLGAFCIDNHIAQTILSFSFFIFCGWCSCTVHEQ